MSLPENCIIVKHSNRTVSIIPIDKTFAEYSYGLSYVPSWVAGRFVEPRFPDYKSFTVFVSGKSMCGSVRGEK